MDNITLGNLKKFLGLCINSGLLRKKNMKAYWSRKSVSQSTPFFATVMPYRTARGQPAFDPWDKGRPVLDSMNSTFKKHYMSPQFISIDESMVGMKNRVAYLQYMPNKRHSRFGIKKFELCDVLTGYVLHVELYAGKDVPIHSDMGQAHAVVMKLLREANGYHLFTDNFYTKLVLANELSAANTLLTGTVRHNSRGLPVLPGRLDIGESMNYRSGYMLLVAWREKKSQEKPVLVLSTSKGAGMREVRTGAGRLKLKTKSVVAYNKYMGGVDLSDRKIYHVSAERPSKLFWNKIFFNLVDMALLNSYILYQANTDAGQTLTRHDYIVAVVESLCLGDGEVLGVPAPHLPVAGLLPHDCVSVSSVRTVRQVYASAARTTAPAAIWAFIVSATAAWTT